jgi:hypothetical protein
MTTKNDLGATVVFYTVSAGWALILASIAYCAIATENACPFCW